MMGDEKLSLLYLSGAGPIKFMISERNPEMAHVEVVHFDTPS
jgi:hypothetical protein